MNQYPHCDARVLHERGECDYCDAHSDWQELRVTWGIAFTGQIPQGDQIACPSEKTRKIEAIERWGGNRPHRRLRGRMIEEAQEDLQRLANDF